MRVNLPWRSHLPTPKSAASGWTCCWSTNCSGLGPCSVPTRMDRVHTLLWSNNKWVTLGLTWHRGQVSKFGLKYISSLTKYILNHTACKVAEWKLEMRPLTFCVIAWSQSVTVVTCLDLSLVCQMYITLRKPYTSASVVENRETQDRNMWKYTLKHVWKTNVCKASVFDDVVWGLCR